MKTPNDLQCRAALIPVFGFLLLSLCVLGAACGGDSARQVRNRRPASKIQAAPRPVPPTEIIVKLKEEGKRLRTRVSGSDTALVYDDDVRLTAFDQLRGMKGVRVRQSFPEFSRRWQAERGWRSRGDDQAAINALGRVLDNCDDTGRPVQQVRALIQKWERSRAVLREHPGADSAIVRLLHGEDSLSTARSRRARVGGPPSRAGDAALADQFIRALREGEGGVIGDRDQGAIAAMITLLHTCGGVSAEDSLAVLGFARRLRQEGGDNGVSSVALAAIDQLVQSRPIGIRDSLAVTSWVRLVAGRDAFRPSRSVPAVDLFLRIHIDNPAVDVDNVLAQVRTIGQVESAFRALPLGHPPSDPAGETTTATRTYAGYQDPAPVGIDAQSAWAIEGGTGKNVRLLVCDASYWSGHSDLPAITINAYTATPGAITVIKEPWAASTNNAIHGTQTLGVLLARDDPEQDDVKGMCRDAREVIFSSALPDDQNLYYGVDGMTSALDRITNWVRSDAVVGGDVLVIEGQLAPDSDIECDGGGCPVMLPVEVNSDTFVFIQTLVYDYDVTVVEAAANGRGLLGVVRSKSAGAVLWDPSDLKWDSGAIIVGAGVPGAGTLSTPLSRMSESNYGERVDCQGWGMLVQTTTFNPYATGTNSGEAFGEFTHTSAATAVVAGLVGCLQSAHFAVLGYYVSPEGLRVALRDPDYGTPQAAEPERIGPLPDLNRLLVGFGIRPPV